MFKFHYLYRSKGKKILSFQNKNTGYYGTVEFLFYRNLWSYTGHIYYKGTYVSPIVNHSYISFKAAKKYFELEALDLFKQYRENKNEI